MPDDRPTLHGVPVDGGTLRVAEWPADRPDAATALLVHGITANHLAWAGVARHLGGLRLLAPDLRGRGASAGLRGPTGLARHADDLAAALDALDVDRAVVAGHSMGGFVAMVLAHRHPDRVAGVLLVDGGLPLAVPADVSAEDLTRAVLGPALARLAMTFASREDYHAFWHQHPGFAGQWNADVEAYVDNDLVGTPPELRSSVAPDAVRDDSIDQLRGTALRDAVDAWGAAPLDFLRAPRDLRDEPPGIYPEERMAEHAARMPGLRWRTVPDVNHYTLLLGVAGAAAVAAAVRELAERDVRSPPA